MTALPTQAFLPGTIVHDPTTNASVIAGFAKELAQTIAMIAVQKFATEKLSEALGFPVGSLKIDEKTGKVTYEPPGGWPGEDSDGDGTPDGDPEDPDVTGDENGNSHVKPKAYLKYVKVAVGILANAGLLRKFPSLSSDMSKVLQDTILTGVGNHEDTRKALETILGAYEAKDSYQANNDRLVKDAFEAVLSQLRVLAQNQADVEKSNEQICKMPGTSMQNEASKTRMVSENLSKQLSLIFHQNTAENTLRIAKELREEAETREHKDREQRNTDRTVAEIVSFFGGPRMAEQPKK